MQSELCSVDRFWREEETFKFGGVRYRIWQLFDVQLGHGFSAPTLPKIDV
jgi:hypothetical protein